MAAAFHAKLTALYVETPNAGRMAKSDKNRLNENMRLAEQLGARIVTSYGEDIVEEIAAYAKVARVSKIVLGRTYTKRRLFFIQDSFSEQLAKLAPDVEIFLIPDVYDQYYKVKNKRSPGADNSGKMWTDALLWIFSLLAATGIAYIFQYLGFSDANLIMVYILEVLVVALITSHQIWGVLASAAGILAFNFCFTAPRGSFDVYDPEYLITFLVMFVTAVISSALTKKVKNYGRESAKKAYRTEILLETSRKLQDAVSAEEIGLRTAQQLGRLLERNIYFYLGCPDEHNLPIVFKKTETAANILDESELGVAQWTYRNNKHAGFSTRTLPAAKCLFSAVRSGTQVFAVVGIDMEGRSIPAFEEGIMGAILNESAFALEKQRLLRERKESELKLQREQLRANLLRSISHDLRTPLTSISGNAETLLGNETILTREMRQGIYRDIYDDSMWLINLVENLLSVTRIENGTMEINLQGELIEDVIEEALRHINRRGKHQKIRMECEEFLMAKVDVKLMIQVIINLVDNAVKYTPDESEIVVRVRKSDDRIRVAVADNGGGILDEQKKRLFDMFYTADNAVADGRRGMGLGLSLCKSIVNAHGGELKVYDNIPHGTVFEFDLEGEEVTL